MLNFKILFTLFPDICSLPSITGRCRGSFYRWYYNKDRAECLQFVYGGCNGNKNNFKTREECERECVAGTSGKLVALFMLNLCKRPVHFQIWSHSLSALKILPCTWAASRVLVWVSGSGGKPGFCTETWCTEGVKVYYWSTSAYI